MLIEDLKNRFLNDLNALAVKSLSSSQPPDEVKRVDLTKIFKSAKLEEPKNKGFGDLTTNAAMAAASILKKNPIDVANIIISEILSKYPEIMEPSVAAPGFINFNLKDDFIFSSLGEIFEKGADYGKNSSGNNVKIQLEYVSSNPTGNLHIGHGRWGVTGDILSSIYESNGFNVQREYYVNDYGTQSRIFAACVKSIYLENIGIPFEYPQDGYPKESLMPVADKLFERFKESLVIDKNTCEVDDETIEKESIDIMLSFIKDTLESIGVVFDCWFKESSLYENKGFEQNLDFLRKNDLVYEKDEALWFKSTNYGDDKDRVLIRADGNPTYFASDIMYLINKKNRGFKQIIYILGADHHGYILRLKAIGKAIGLEDNCVNVIIGQLVRLTENGEVLKMSRRKGRSVTLDDLVSEVGKDAVRYFFSMNSFDTHLDFDISLAKKKSNSNPVFYVQYAHARIRSILRKISAQSCENFKIDALNIDLKQKQGLFKELVSDKKECIFKNESERNLAVLLLKYPDVVLESCRNNSCYYLNQYAYKLAGSFHYFYNHNKILSKSKKVNIKRFLLAMACEIVLKNCLEILGISAPDKM